jgi:hypothetical protein
MTIYTLSWTSRHHGSACSGRSCGNIVQFIDAWVRIIKATNDIRQSTSGITSRQATLRELVERVGDLGTCIIVSSSAPLSSDQSELRTIAQDCSDISHQMLDLIARIAPSDPNSKLRAVMAALRGLRSSRELEDLEKKLRDIETRFQSQHSKVVG